jgi:CrcB protein
MTWLAVATGGALGSLARHAVNAFVARMLGSPSPISTAIVNIVGCAIIGVLAGLLAGSALRITPPWRALVFVGVLGGFTTFSSFGLDTLTLMHEGRTAAALANVVVQVVAGVGAVFLGYNAALGLFRL